MCVWEVAIFSLDLLELVYLQNKDGRAFETGIYRWGAVVSDDLYSGLNAFFL